MILKGSPMPRAIGDCAECGRTFRLTKAGKVWNHSDKKSWPPRNCDGAGREPKPHGTSGGVELTDERIQQLADEAEHGYDITQLRERS